MPHPIPRLDRSMIPPRPIPSLDLLVARLAPRATQYSGSHPSPAPAASRKIVAPGKGPLACCGLLAALALASTGCTVLTYTGSQGEQFSRRSLGASTSLAALVVETGTNGLHRVELRGYNNDGTQALGTVTEAAVKAAIQNLK